VTRRPDGASTREDLPGLQAERTRLSWERAALAAIVNGALLLFARAHHWMVLWAAGFGLVLALTLALLGIRRGRRIASDGHAVEPALRLVPLSGGCVALFGTTVLAVLCLAPSP
jgi:putative membrane protein